MSTRPNAVASGTKEPGFAPDANDISSPRTGYPPTASCPSSLSSSKIAARTGVEPVFPTATARAMAEESKDEPVNPPGREYWDHVEALAAHVRPKLVDVVSR
jgi:hypothetical protein